MRAVYIDSFVVGSYRVKSPSGKQVIIFEDSDQFGPSKVNMRTGDVEPLPDKSWFWRFYPPWREAGRPTEGAAQSTPCGPLLNAKWANDGEAA